MNRNIKDNNASIFRGGRLMKTSVGLVSFAPSLVGASALAIGSLLATASPVEAGTCTGFSGRWTCIGAARSNDGTQTIAGDVGEDVTVIPSGFGLTVSSGKGLVLTSVAGTNSADLNLVSNNISDPVSISAMGNAVDIDWDSTAGPVTFRIDGNVTSSHGKGINVVAAPVATGDVTITVDGNIQAETQGIDINQDGDGLTTVVVNGDITTTNTNTSGTISAQGIHIHTAGDINDTPEMTAEGDVHVTVNGNITGGANSPIEINGIGTGNITVIVNGMLSRTGSRGQAISIIGHGSAEHRIVLQDGAVFDMSAQRLGVTSRGTTTLELTGSRDDKEFDLAGLAGTGEAFDIVEKTGSGTWTLVTRYTINSGDNPHHSTNHDFQQVNVNSGTLVLDIDASDLSGPPILNFREDPSITIASGASLQVGESVNTSGGVTLNLDGHLRLSGADGAFEVGALQSNGGTIVVDVDIPDADIELPTARLNTGMGAATATQSVVVQVRAIDEIPEIEEPVTIGNFISVGGEASLGEGTFVAAAGTDSPFRFDLQLDERASANVWDLVVSVPPEMSTVHDTFTAVLAQLARPRSLAERLAGRNIRSNTNTFGKISSSTVEIEPSAGSFDTQGAAVEFGTRAPLNRIFDESWARNLVFDAGISFGRVNTEATVDAGVLDIATNSFGAVLGATWSRRGFYVDGQLGYSRLENGIEDAEGNTLANPGADSYSVALEIGRVLRFGNVNIGDDFGEISESVGMGDFTLRRVRLVPSAQLAWNDVNFNDYVSTAGTPVSLDDGDVLYGRVGVLAQSRWNGVGLHARVHAIVPLDGEVSTRVDGVEMFSKREDLAADIGLGAMYEWDGYAVSTGVSTQQGGEVEGYAANIGFKYAF